MKMQKEENDEHEEVTDFQAVPGNGLSANLDGHNSMVEIKLYQQ